MTKRLLFVAFLEATLGIFPVQAARQNSQESVLAYEIPGSPRCWNVAAGARELRITRPVRGVSVIASDSTGFAVRYSIGADGRGLTWEIPNGDAVAAGLRVNIVLLTTGGGNYARAYYLPPQGATGDTVERSLLPISQVAFCYGLAGTRAGSSPAALPRCESGCRIDPLTLQEATQILLRGDPNSGSRWEPCACGGPIDEYREEECTPGVDNNCDDGWYCYKSGGKRVCVYR